MAVAQMYEMNEKVISLEKMIAAAAKQCGVQPPEDNADLWQLTLPPNLTPDQASSWYKMLSLVKRKRRAVVRANELDNLLPCYILDLPEDKQSEIRRILNNVSTDTPPNVSHIRSGKNYVFQSVSEKYQHIEDSEFKKKFLLSVTGTLEEKIMQNKHYNLNFKRDSRLDHQYEQEWNSKIRNSRYLEILDYRRNLPAYYKVEDLIRIVSEEQVVLISGETGCGKTTQIPQFILDFELKSGRGSVCHIICTQPRRISAISISERVAQERAEKLGESVGYQIRLEGSRPRRTGSILFCTTGTLLQMMQSDPVLRNVSHVILDEIHERNTMSDFILAILKDIIQLRKDLKVILMSASMNAERFSAYFNNCPIIEIPGRSFPVTEYFLEDILQMTGYRYIQQQSQTLPPPKSSKEEMERNRYREEFLIPYTRSPQAMKNYAPDILESLLSPQADQLNMELIFDLICFICEQEPPGAILVFLPGWDRILKLLNRLKLSSKFPENKYIIVPLHSMLSTIAQKSVFSTPPAGIRKIVISTNIAETSITIDDIVYVIDSGMEKLSDFDTTDNICTLDERWISQANAKQRKGRAGRVRAGYCYKLYSRPKDMFLAPYQLPEMLRTRLEEVILQTKVLQLGHTESFLSKVMDPPSHEAVKLSLELLQGMNALDDEEQLTPLGYHLAHLPIDPMSGKMVLLGALFGCIDPVSSIAACLSLKDCFAPPPGKLEQLDNIRKKLSENTKSDHILMAKVFDKWRDSKKCNRSREFAHENMLNSATLHMIRDCKNQLTKHLADMGFLKHANVLFKMSNHNAENIPLLRSIVCAGLYPNIGVVSKMKQREKNRFTVILSTMEDQHVCLHQRSVNSQVEEFDSAFFAYFTKIRSKQMYLFDTTMVFPMAIFFFCHSFHIEDQGDRKIIAINKKIRFSCKRETANLLQELRAWLDWLMDYKVAHPCSIDWTMNNDEIFIFKAIIGLLSLEIKVKDPELQEQVAVETPRTQVIPNFGQFGSTYYNPTSHLLTLDQSMTNTSEVDVLPWMKQDSGSEKGMCDMSGSDMSSMSAGEEGLLSFKPKRKKKKLKKVKTEFKVKIENGVDMLDDRPWLRTLVSPLRDKELQVAVIIRDLQPMTYEEANIVKRALITEVGLALRGMGPNCNGTIIQLRFTESRLVPPGLFLITCLDNETRDWLLKWTPPKLQFSPNRFLQVVMGNSLMWPEKLQVAVVLKDFAPISSKDADDIRTGLVSDVNLVLSRGTSIQFTNLEFVDPGWLLITCLDRNSRNWVLKWIPPRVRTCQPYVVTADSLPWPIRIGLVIQTDQKPEWDSVCYYIRHQNDNIDVDSWKFLESNQTPEGAWMMTFNVSPKIVKELDKLGWRLFYQIDFLSVIQFGKIPLFSNMAPMPGNFPIPFQQNQQTPFQQTQPMNFFNYFPPQ